MIDMNTVVILITWAVGLVVIMGYFKYEVLMLRYHIAQLRIADNPKGETEDQTAEDAGSSGD